MLSPKLKISLQAILACLLWSSASIGIKIGLPYTSTLQFAGIRFFISGLLVLPVAIYFIYKAGFYEFEIHPVFSVYTDLSAIRTILYRNK